MTEELCECGQPRNSIRHSNAAAKSIDAHAFKPAAPTDPYAKLEALRDKWKSGPHAEKLREIWNSHGENSEYAGLQLDELLNCADELTVAIAELRAGEGKR